MSPTADPLRNFTTDPAQGQHPSPPQFGSIQFAEAIENIWRMLRDDEMQDWPGLSPIASFLEAMDRLVEAMDRHNQLLKELVQSIPSLDYDTNPSLERVANALERIADSLGRTQNGNGHRLVPAERAWKPRKATEMLSQMEVGHDK